jgi:hypothetical protein
MYGMFDKGNQEKNTALLSAKFDRNPTNGINYISSDACIHVEWYVTGVARHHCHALMALP